jgi:hypothetical protein
LQSKIYEYLDGVTPPDTKVFDGRVRTMLKDAKKLEKQSFSFLLSAEYLTTRGIKHWGLSGYSNILPRIKFGVTGQESSPQSPTISYRHPSDCLITPFEKSQKKMHVYICISSK